MVGGAATSLQRYVLMIELSIVGGGSTGNMGGRRLSVSSRCILQRPPGHIIVDRTTTSFSGFHTLDPCSVSCCNGWSENAIEGRRRGHLVLFLS
jgi:hypothetical protein